MNILTLKNGFTVNVTSPAEIILWNHVTSLIPYTNITPIYYEGVTAAPCEFIVVLATKYYIALELEFECSIGSGGGLEGINLFNNAGGLINFLSNPEIFWDGLATIYASGRIVVRNIFFSHIAVVGNYDVVKFIGYRIDY